MTSQIYFPSLDEFGWLTDSAQIVDKLIAHYLESNYSQTSLYLGSVSSFAYIFQNNKDSINNTISALIDSLTIYFARYFPLVEVEVKDITKDPNSSNVSLSIFVSITDINNKIINIERLIETQNSVVANVIKTLNG